MSRFDPRPLASRFWQLAGFQEEYPRDLRRAAVLALPVSIISVSPLSTSTVNEWLFERGVLPRMQARRMPLSGCLIANKGHGLIFVDGSLEADEMRVTLAHEVAHFMEHYDGPRHAALASLGESIKPVLDGERAPTPEERLSGVLRGIALGCHSHLLRRNRDGAPPEAVIRAETEADLAGFELLAPSDRLLHKTRAGVERRTELIRSYGLPPWAAQVWSAWLDAKSAGDPLIHRLKAAAKVVRLPVEDGAGDRNME